MWLKSDTKHWQLQLTPDLARHVHRARGFIRNSSDNQQDTRQSWLLHHHNRHCFTVWLLALIAEGKTPLLPANGQAETLGLVREHADAELLQVPLPAPRVTDAEGMNNQLKGSLDAELVVFTSGSSGTPKAVRKTMRQLFNEVRTLEATFGELLGDSLIVSTLTHQHIYGLLFTVLWPLCAGRKVADERLDYPEQWLAFHQHNSQPYALVSGPAQLERYTQALELSQFRSQLRAVFSSGGPLNESVATRCIEAQISSPIEVYGSTETGGIGWRQRQQGMQNFRAFAGISVQQDEFQCLQIRSTHIDASDCDPRGWYTTSDQVRLVADDEFTIIGRADRIVKLAEKRLSLTEVEQLCSDLKWVQQAKCCVLESSFRTELGLVVQLNHDGLRLLAAEGKFGLRQRLRQHLAQRFESVVLPRKFRYLSELPYNEAGKLTQTALQQLFQSSATSDNDARTVAEPKL